jgi:3-phenylpropionate/cinnamic acid dioxygenase small subunit
MQETLSPELAARVLALEDESAITRTLCRYSHAIDYGLEEEWADCFTDDAVFEVRLRDGQLFVQREGKAELLAFARGHTRPPAAYHKHFVGVPVVTVNGDEATADSYFARFDMTDDKSATYIKAMGRYRDQLVRGADGVWRIRKRFTEIQNR